MFGLGHSELLIILLIAVVFFGAKRLPEIGKALGRIGSEYRDGKDSAQPSPETDQAGRTKANPPDSGPDIEAEIKNHLISRMPGIGRLNKFKKTAEMVGKVARAAEKTRGTSTSDRKDS